MGYQDQFNEISRVRVDDDQTKRIDCVFCGGKNTMTVTKRDGKLIWNCYKASCNSKGVATVDRGIDSIKRSLSGSRLLDRLKRPSSFPELLVSTKGRANVEIYLRENHCYTAQQDGLVTIKYAPREDRVLFFTKSGEGAVGRSLNGQKPKWRAYGDTSYGLSCGTGGTVVVVEDAASACAVASCCTKYTGFALLGTQLTKKHINLLTKYQDIVIALDKDATAKGLKFKRLLMGHHNSVRLCLLTEDLKWLSRKNIEGKLDESAWASSY